MRKKPTIDEALSEVREHLLRYREEWSDENLLLFMEVLRDSILTALERQVERGQLSVESVPAHLARHLIFAGMESGEVAAIEPMCRAWDPARFPS